MAIQCKTLISTVSIADLETKISAWIASENTPDKVLKIHNTAAAEGTLGGASIKCIIIYEILTTAHKPRA